MLSFDAFGEVNYLAVLVAAAAYFVLGAVWYAPPVMGRIWQKAAGVTMAEGEGPSPMLFIGNFIAYVVMGLATAILAIWTGVSGAGDGFMLGLVIGVGYAATATGVAALYEQKPEPLTFFFANGIYTTAGLVLMALIIGAWG